MEHKTEHPMNVVENATAALSQISSLCALIMILNRHDFCVQPEDVAQAMAHFRLCLDEQIRALDGIQWT